MLWSKWIRGLANDVICAAPALQEIVWEIYYIRTVELDMYIRTMALVFEN